MTSYDVEIRAKLEAKNFESAQRKLADLERRVSRSSVHAAHIQLAPTNGGKQ